MKLFSTPKKMILRVVTVLLATGYSQLVFANCDCGSENQNAPCTGKSIQVSVKGEKAEKYHTVQFNWAFHSGGSDATCGQFANGDYWVAPAPGQSSVTITAVSGQGSGPVFVDENPNVESMGFLTHDYGNLNTDENIVPKLPYSITGDSSLLAGMERNTGCGTKGIAPGCIDAYNALTILATVPQNAGADVFRPNLYRTQKDLWTWDDFDLTRIPSKSYFSGTDDAGLEETRTRWSHHTEVMSLRTASGEKFSEGGRAFRADLVTDDYGATVAQQWHTQLIQLMSDDHSITDKKPALAAMLTYGKDIYYGIYDAQGKQERTYGAGAGQWLGRFPPVAFFAAIAKNKHYSNILSAASSTQASTTQNIHGIHELDQVNIGPNGPVWGDNNLFDELDTGRYWGEMLSYKAYAGAPGGEGTIRGKKTFRDPYGYIDGPGAYPGILYASVSAGPIKALAAEMLLIPEMCETVNYDALIEYAIRITDVGIQVANDPCAPPDPRENGCNPYARTGCKYYGLNNNGEATWGPNPNDLTQCIRNGTDPITGEPQRGRFGHLSGDELKFKIGYPVHQIENNWQSILANRTSCNIGDRPSPPTNFRFIDTE